jgi:hypothetical protein
MRAIIMMTNTMSSTATATHPTPGVLARIAAIGARLGRFPLAIHQLLFRFAIAAVFLRAGLDKVRSWGDHGRAVPRRVQGSRAPA